MNRFWYKNVVTLSEKAANTGVYWKMYIQGGSERQHNQVQELSTFTKRRCPASIFVVAVHRAAHFYILDLILARTCTLIWGVVILENQILYFLVCLPTVIASWPTTRDSCIHESPTSSPPWQASRNSTDQTKLQSNPVTCQGKALPHSNVITNCVQS